MSYATAVLAGISVTSFALFFLSIPRRSTVAFTAERRDPLQKPIVQNSNAIVPAVRTSK